MDSKKTLAAIAFSIGFLQMYNDIMKSDDVDEKSKNTVLLSVVASTAWLIYQSRQHGLSFPVIYTTLSLMVQVYILNKILIKENEKNMFKIQ